MNPPPPLSLAARRWCNDGADDYKPRTANSTVIVRLDRTIQ
jgi:hypothetical protein